MKLCLTVLSLLVLGAAFCSPALSAPMGSDPPTACCFSYTTRQLPRGFVVDYYETSSLCSQPAVVFQTKRGRQVCANPSEAWAQDYISDLELNWAAPGAGPGPQGRPSEPTPSHRPSEPEASQLVTPSPRFTTPPGSPRPFS